MIYKRKEKNILKFFSYAFLFIILLSGCRSENNLINKEKYLYDGIKRDSDGYIYYASDQGERLTYGKYINGYSYEHQGFYARVRMEDGKWAIINREEEIIASEFDSINHLPDVYVVGSGMKNGIPVIFYLPAAPDKYMEIEVPGDYISISTVTNANFAIMETEEHLYGVVCAWEEGHIVIPAIYSNIEVVKIRLRNGDFIRDGYRFTVTNVDGSKEIFRFRWFEMHGYESPEGISSGGI